MPSPPASRKPGDGGGTEQSMVLLPPRAAPPSQPTAAAQKELPEAPLLIALGRAQQHGEGMGGKERSQEGHQARSRCTGNTLTLKPLLLYRFSSLFKPFPEQLILLPPRMDGVSMKKWDEFTRNSVCSPKRWQEFISCQLADRPSYLLNRV